MSKISPTTQKLSKEVQAQSKNLKKKNNKKKSVQIQPEVEVKGVSMEDTSMDIEQPLEEDMFEAVDIMPVEQQDIEIKDEYKSLPITKSCESSRLQGVSDEVKFHIYYKHAWAVAQNKNSLDEEALDVLKRSIVVSGVPVEYNLNDVQEIFEAFGDVETIFVRSDASLIGRGTPTYQVVFIDMQDVQRVMTIEDALTHVEGTQTTGIQTWKDKYLQQRPNQAELQKQVDLFLFAFDKRSEQEKQAAKMKFKSKIVDEDGFVLIQSKRNRGSSKTSFHAAAKKYKMKLDKRRELTENFYRYSSQEQKLSRLNALRRKFDEDKEKLTELRSTRNFKPF